MMSVRDVMTTNVVTVLLQTSLRDVAKLMVERRISGLPVVDEAGAVVGVISEADFLLKEQGPEAVRHRPLARVLGESRTSRSQLARLAARTAGEAMTTPAITAPPWMRIGEAAAIMTSRGINRLPVVDSGKLIGVVSRADLVRAYVRTDEELARTIRDEVLLRTLWLDPAMFTIVVADGVVSISGGVERRTTADMIGRALRMVPGIVDVQADVTWWLDDSRREPSPGGPEYPFL
jgi:CBS domain-containing protein